MPLDQLCPVLTASNLAFNVDILCSPCTTFHRPATVLSAPGLLVRLYLPPGKEFGTQRRSHSDSGSAASSPISPKILENVTGRKHLAQEQSGEGGSGRGNTVMNGVCETLYPFSFGGRGLSRVNVARKERREEKKGRAEKGGRKAKPL